MRNRDRVIIGKMSESKANQCEFHLIKAWMPVSKPYLKASVKSITDLNILGFSGEDTLFSTAVLPENHYLALVYNHFSGIQKISKIDLKTMSMIKGFSPTITSISILVKDTVILTTGVNEKLQVYKNGRFICNIDLVNRHRTCKSNYIMMNKSLQQINDSLL